MFAVLLPLGDAPLQIQAVHNDPDEVVVILSTTAPTACCPLCQHDSARVHSRYQRTLWDLPLTARAVRLHLQVRRFFCRAPDCPRAIFTERLPTLTRPYAHRTTRLAAALLQIGLALGGKAGARLAQILHLASSPDTLLRLVRRLPEPPPATTPRVIGIDDWVRPVPSKQAHSA